MRTTAKNLWTKLLFALQLNHTLDTLDKTLTKTPIKKFKRFVWSKNKQDLIMTFKSKQEYVRICKILAKISKVFKLGPLLERIVIKHAVLRVCNVLLWEFIDVSTFSPFALSTKMTVQKKWVIKYFWRKLRNKNKKSCKLFIFFLGGGLLSCWTRSLKVCRVERVHSAPRDKRLTLSTFSSAW